MGCLGAAGFGVLREVILLLGLSPYAVGVIVLTGAALSENTAINVAESVGATRQTPPDVKGVGLWEGAFRVCEICCLHVVVTWDN